MKELGFKKVIKNASWIIAGKILQACISFIISIFTTRYLGPTSFGTINYAISVVSFIIPFAELGFSFVLVRELSQEADEGKVLGTSVRLSILSSLICFVLINVFFLSTNTDTDSKTTMIVCSIYSLRIILVGFELINYWFQAHLLSKYTSIIGLVATGIIALYKIFILSSNKNIYWFTCVNLFDYLVIVVLEFLLYKRVGGEKFGYSKELAKKLLSQAPYYVIASLTISIFSNTDKIMIKHMLGEYQVGVYSLAFSFVGYSSFIFSAIIDSFRPSIMLACNEDNDLFGKRTSCLYSIVIYLALTQAVLIMIFGKILIEKLYGSSFIESSGVLQIVVWYTVFSYIGAVNGIWIVAKNQQKYLLYQNIIGSILNVILNYWLIAKYGVNGAAFATLVTQFLSNTILYAVMPSLRPCFVLMLKGLNPRIIKNIKNIYK